MAITAFTAAQAQQKIIKLKNQKLNYTPKEFYISGITDHRPDTSKLGTMRAGISNKHVEANLQNGTAAGLMAFIDANIKQDKTKPALEMHLDRFDISEQSNGFKERLDLAAEVSFHSNDKLLFNYTFNSYAESGMDVSPYIAKLLSQFTEYTLKELDKSIAQNRDLLAEPSLLVTAEIGTTPSDPDHIPYLADMPLVKENFKGKADKLSIASAATYSGFGVRYLTETKGNTQKVRVVITPYFDMMHSWWRPVKDEKTILAHEQLHFDITALYAHKYADLIKAHTFITDDLAIELEKLQRQVQKELEQAQEDYDTETNHGRIKDKQQAWEQKIKEELAAVKV